MNRRDAIRAPGLIALLATNVPAFTTTPVCAAPVPKERKDYDVTRLGLLMREWSLEVGGNGCCNLQWITLREDADHDANGEVSLVMSCGEHGTLYMSGTSIQDVLEKTRRELDRLKE